MNDHCFVDVEGGGKGGRPRMAGPTRTRVTTAEENQRIIFEQFPIQLHG